MEKGKKRKKYQILLLDVDGTLLDFNQSERLGISKLLVTYGFPVLEEYILLYHDINEQFWQKFNRGEISKTLLLTARFHQFFGQLGRETDGAEAEKYYREFLDQSAILLPEAAETCHYLSRKYACYIVTNGTSSTQYKRLALSGLDQFVKGIFVSEDAGSQKPQKAYFDYCFSKIFPRKKEVGEEEKSQMLIIGDSLHSDVLGGNYAGIDTCWINPNHQPGEEGIYADYEVCRISDLLTFL